MYLSKKETKKSGKCFTRKVKLSRLDLKSFEFISHFHSLENPLMTLAQMSQVTDVHSQSTPVADPESVQEPARSLQSGRTQQPTEEQEGRELRKTSQEVETVAASHHHHSFIINMGSGHLESVSGVIVSVRRPVTDGRPVAVET